MDKPITLSQFQPRACTYGSYLPCPSCLPNCGGTSPVWTLPQAPVVGAYCPISAGCSVEDTVMAVPQTDRFWAYPLTPYISFPNGMSADGNNASYGWYLGKLDKDRTRPNTSQAVNDCGITYFPDMQCSPKNPGIRHTNTYSPLPSVLYANL